VYCTAQTKQAQRAQITIEKYFLTVEKVVSNITSMYSINVYFYLSESEENRTVFVRVNNAYFTSTEMKLVACEKYRQMHTIGQRRMSNPRF
jgi:hypothetical protein